MIYLIDDKIKRQQDYGWHREKLNQYSEVLTFVHIFNEIEDVELRKEIFSDNNIVLFHESFFDNIDNKHDRTSDEIRNRLEKEAEEGKSFKVYFFSGSISSRKINDFSGFLPVVALYQNLECFLDNGIANGTFDVNYLFFGKYPKIENYLLNNLENANRKWIGVNKIHTQKKNLVIRTSKSYIPKLIDNADYEFIFNAVEDNDLHEKVTEVLSKSVYDNIFLPLCFGQTLSDYNGLRLATHIRCTDTPNQLKNIFIYGFVGLNHLLDNEYFDILKTKNVFKINYTIEAFKKANEEDISLLAETEFSKEISKLALLPPKNKDNHGVSNEWAIYRWAKVLNIADDEINHILSYVQSNLYFKYLRTIYPISEATQMQDDQLKINFGKKSKVLYIDDEAEKGWNKIFNKIFAINNIDFKYLDSEFNSKSRKEILDISLKKIIDDDIDLVILDFRLHNSDQDDKNTEEITGIQLLKKIKEYNSGIQVIIFSATNKIWNLQEIQKVGADGFIIKESPENSINKNFTIKLINDFLITLEESIKMQFLKSAFASLNKIENNFKILFNGQNDLLSEIESYLNIAYQLLNNYRVHEKYLNYAYIQLFLIIELYVSQEYIFFCDENEAYVVLNSSQVFVQQKNGDECIRAINFTKNGKYEIQKNSFKIVSKVRLDTNFKVSAILIFRFGNENSSVLNWTNIYKVRNNKAAHYDKDNTILTNELFDLLKFIEYLSNQTNINNANAEKGLKKKSFEDYIQELKSDPRFVGQHTGRKKR